MRLFTFLITLYTLCCALPLLLSSFLPACMYHLSCFRRLLRHRTYWCCLATLFCCAALALSIVEQQQQTLPAARVLPSLSKANIRARRHSRKVLPYTSQWGDKSDHSRTRPSTSPLLTEPADTPFADSTQIAEDSERKVPLTIAEVRKGCLGCTSGCILKRHRGIVECCLRRRCRDIAAALPSNHHTTTAEATVAFTTVAAETTAESATETAPAAVGRAVTGTKRASIDRAPVPYTQKTAEESTATDAGWEVDNRQMFILRGPKKSIQVKTGCCIWTELAPEQDTQSWAATAKAPPAAAAAAPATPPCVAGRSCASLRTHNTRATPLHSSASASSAVAPSDTSSAASVRSAAAVHAEVASPFTFEPSSFSATAFHSPATAGVRAAATSSAAAFSPSVAFFSDSASSLSTSSYAASSLVAETLCSSLSLPSAVINPPAPLPSYPPFVSCLSRVSPTDALSRRFSVSISPHATQSSAAHPAAVIENCAADASDPPAAGYGAVTIESRVSDGRTAELVLTGAVSQNDESVATTLLPEGARSSRPHHFAHAVVRTAATPTGSLCSACSLAASPTRAEISLVQSASPRVTNAVKPLTAAATFGTDDTYAIQRIRRASGDTRNMRPLQKPSTFSILAPSFPSSLPGSTSSPLPSISHSYDVSPLSPRSSAARNSSFSAFSTSHSSVSSQRSLPPFPCNGRESLQLCTQRSSEPSTTPPQAGHAVPFSHQQLPPPAADPIRLERAATKAALQAVETGTAASTERATMARPRAAESNHSPAIAADATEAGGSAALVEDVKFSEPSEEDLQKLTQEFVEDVGDKLKQQASRCAARGEGLLGEEHRRERAYEQLQLCSRFRTYARPGSSYAAAAAGRAGKALLALKRVFNRLAGFLGRRERGERHVLLKIQRLIEDVSRRSSSICSSRSRFSCTLLRALATLKRLGAAAWSKTSAVAFRIIAHLLRYMPLIMLLVYVVCFSLSVSAVAVAPSLLTVLSLAGTVLNIVSFVFATGAEFERQNFTANLFSTADLKHEQIFGLVWAELRAEAELQEAVSDNEHELYCVEGAYERIAVAERGKPLAPRSFTASGAASSSGDAAGDEARTEGRAEEEGSSRGGRGEGDGRTGGDARAPAATEAAAASGKDTAIVGEEDDDGEAARIMGGLASAFDDAARLRLPDFLPPFAVAPTEAYRRAMKHGRTTVPKTADCRAAGEEGENEKGPDTEPLLTEDYVRKARERMRQNLLDCRTRAKKLVPENDKSSGEKEGRRKLTQIAVNTVLNLFETANVGVQKLFMTFGRAWRYFVRVSLARPIRFFKMLKAFQAVTSFFEKLQCILRWIGSRNARIVYNVTEPYRSLVLFFFNRKAEIVALMQGALLPANPGSLLFLGSLIYVISKPAWSLYLTSLGMLREAVYSKAKQEFKANHAALRSFLLGASAFTSGVGEPLIRISDASQSKLIDILFIMTFLDQYRGPLEREDARAPSLSAWEAYMVYERTQQLQRFVELMPKHEQQMFVTLFKDIRTWNPSKSLNGAHVFLLDTMHLCALKYGKHYFRKELQDQLQKLHARAEEENETLSSASACRLIARKAYYYVVKHSDALYSSVKLQWVARRAVSGFGALPPDEELVDHVASLIHQVAVEVLEKEVLIRLYKGNVETVDRTQLRVSNVPFHTHHYSEELQALLQRFFEYNPTQWESLQAETGTAADPPLSISKFLQELPETETEASLAASPGSDCPGERQLNAQHGLHRPEQRGTPQRKIGFHENQQKQTQEHLYQTEKQKELLQELLDTHEEHTEDKRPLLRQRTKQLSVKLRIEVEEEERQPQGIRLDCGPGRPTVKLEPKFDSAIISFEAYTREECAAAATRYFMDIQVHRSFQLTTRRVFFKKSDATCAQFQSSAVMALDTLMDELALSSLPERQQQTIARELLDQLIGDFSSVQALMRELRHKRPQAGRDTETETGSLDFLQRLRWQLLQREWKRAATVFVRDAVAKYFTVKWSRVHHEVESALLTIDMTRTVHRQKLLDYVASRLDRVGVSGSTVPEKAVWNMVKEEFPRQFVDEMQLAQPDKASLEVTQLPWFLAMFFSWTPFDKQQALVTRLLQHVFTRLRTAAGAGGEEMLPRAAANAERQEQQQTCAAASREMIKLQRHITNITMAAGHPSGQAEVRSDIMSAIREVEEKLTAKLRDIARVLQWGNWYPENFLCMKWQANTPQLLRNIFKWTARTLRGKRGILWRKRLKSRLFERAEAKKREEEEAIAREIVERLYLTHLFGFDGMEDHFSLRYTYKKSS